VKRPPHHFTVSALAAHLRTDRAATLRLISQAGITLPHTPLHYTDTTPRKSKVRHWRALSLEEVKQVLRFHRARQGARLLRRQMVKPT